MLQAYRKFCSQGAAGGGRLCDKHRLDCWLSDSMTRASTAQLLRFGFGSGMACCQSTSRQCICTPEMHGAMPAGGMLPSISSHTS